MHIFLQDYFITYGPKIIKKNVLETTVSDEAPLPRR